MPAFAPVNEGRVLVDGLFALHVFGHLIFDVFEIRGTEGALGVVDVKAFRLLCIIIVCGTEKCDGSGIVDETMELGDAVEMFPDSKIDQNVLLLMKSTQ